eukprot:12413375-Alexandrium_andersonii.AAC.1
MCIRDSGYQPGAFAGSRSELYRAAPGSDDERFAPALGFQPGACAGDRSELYWAASGSDDERFAP